MNKKKVKKTGPIATKFINSLVSTSKQNVIELEDRKLTHNSEKRNLSKYDPLHAIYLEGHYSLVDFIELFSVLPYSHKLNKIMQQAEELYIPSGSPISPITKSYFFNWMS